MANDRLREAAQAIRLVPPEDRVTGSGASFVMAPFAYIRAGRFSPHGARGVYYAGESLDTAIAETTFHRARFFAETREQPSLAENRVIEATIEGDVADVAVAPARTRKAVLDPDSYAASFRFGAEVFAAGRDGVVYPSVRRRDGTCVAIFRPRCVRNARTTMYLGYRWDGARISDVFKIESLNGPYSAEPGAR